MRNVVYNMIAAYKYVTQQKLKEELPKQIIDLSNSTLRHLLKHLETCDLNSKGTVASATLWNNRILFQNV